MAEAATEQQLKALANMLLLQQRLREAQNEAELGFVLVNDSQSLIPYRSALLWLAAPASDDRGRINNVSGAVDHDEHAPFLQWMKQLCREAARLAEGKLREFTKSEMPEGLAGE